MIGLCEDYANGKITEDALKTEKKRRLDIVLDDFDKAETEKPEDEEDETQEGEEEKPEEDEVEAEDQAGEVVS